MFKILSVLTALHLAHGQALELETRTQSNMGTYFSLSLEKKDRAHFRPAFDLIRELDAKLSHYKENSEISLLNRSGKISPSPATFRILRESIAFSRLTDGAFDVTVGALTEAYGFNGDSPKIPNERDLAEKKKLVSYRSVKISGEKVEFLQAGLRIDLGGIGKGFAVDRVAEYLKSTGVKAGIIAASGDIRCLHLCEFFIDNPFDEKNPLGPFAGKIRDLSLSTSGNYRNFISDKKINHLLNPKEGKPQRAFASVTLFIPADNTKADALATAVAVMPLDRAKSFLEREKIAYVLILTGGRLIKSRNLEDTVAFAKSGVPIMLRAQSKKDIKRQNSKIKKEI